MTANVGSIDRVLRLIAGAVLIALPFVAGFTSTLWMGVAIAAGIVMLTVAATRVCPLYALFGIRTCRT